jgi:hypothetical protein
VYSDIYTIVFVCLICIYIYRHLFKDDVRYMIHIHIYIYTSLNMYVQLSSCVIRHKYKYAYMLSFCISLSLSLSLSLTLTLSRTISLSPSLCTYVVVCIYMSKSLTTHLYHIVLLAGWLAGWRVAFVSLQPLRERVSCCLVGMATPDSSD